MKYLSSIFAFLFAFTLGINAQNNTIDSLYLELEKAKEDSTTIKIQIGLADLLKSSYADSSIVLSNNAIELSKKANLPNLELLALTSLSTAYSSKGTYLLQSNLSDSALVYYKKAIKIGEKVKAYNTLAFTYNNMGILYFQIGLYDLASENMIKSIEIRKQAGLKVTVGNLLNIGLISIESNNLEVALDYFKQALAVGLEEENKHMIGMTYQNIGALLTQMDSLDEAIEYLNKSNEINLELNDSSAITKYYIGLADVYKKQDRTEDWISNYELAADYFPLNGNKRQWMFLNLDLATAYYEGGSTTKQYDLNRTVQLAKTAYDLSDELHLNRNKSMAAVLLFKLYSDLGKEKEAVYYVNVHLEIQDSLFSADKINALSEIQTKYETEKKEAEIEFLDKENQIKADNLKQAEELQQNQLLIILLLAFGFVIAAGAIYWIYKIYIEKKKANEALESKNSIISTQKEEKEVLLKEIHHRVKNNLQVISSLLDLQSDNILDKTALSAVEDGQSRVKAMALIHQNLYQNQDIASISFEEYANQLVKQLASVYSGENKVEVKLNSKETFFDIDTAIPLGLILNELISNAYKYAFQGETQGKLHIHLEEVSTGEYCLYIKDNGKGLPSGFEISKTTSLGLKLVRRLCKQLYGSVAYENKNGTNFTIRFKDTNARKTVF